MYGDSWNPPEVVASCSSCGGACSAGQAWPGLGLGSAWAGWPRLGSGWLFLGFEFDFRLAFGWISLGFWLRLDFGLILVWLDLDLV